MHIAHFILFPFSLIIMFYGFGSTNGYIMPICGKYCETCDGQYTETNDDSDGLSQVRKTSELFFFVTNTMEVVRNILYKKVLPLFLYEKPKPKDSSYIDSMWMLFGFHVESEAPEDEEFVFCNGSIFALIFVFYFGYLFMATKCVNTPKYLDEENTKFLSYLEPSQDDIYDENATNEICCHHSQEMHEDDQNMTMIPYELYDTDEQ